MVHKKQVFATLFVTILGLVGGIVTGTRLHPTTTTTVRADVPVDLSRNMTLGSKTALQMVSTYSPDGTQSVTLTKQNRLVEVFTSRIATSKPVYQTLISESQEFTLPKNSWSPSHNYFFIKEVRNDVASYYVFSVFEGADTVTSVNLSEIFLTSQPKYTITEVTGWADPNLLIVNAVSKESNQPISFWFDVTTNSFIPLGTYFD